MLADNVSLVEVRDAKNLTPLHVAASRGKSDIAQLLIDFGADVHGPTDDGEWSPLVFAAYRGHVEVARILLENGAGVTADDGNPIHFSGQRKHKELCRLLVEYGAVDGLIESNDADALALFRAAYSYDSDAVEKILCQRPLLVAFTDRDGRTALHEACTHGDTKTVRVLLKHGADVNARDFSGQTPKDRALGHNQKAVLRILTKCENAT